MTADFETVELVETWLYATLSGDPTLSGLVSGRVIGTVNPLQPGVNPPVPFVVFTLSGTRDITAQDGTTIDTDSRYVIKAVNAGSSWEVVKPIAKRIHALLHLPGITVSTPGGGSLTSVRDSVLQYPEESSGQQYRHLGGIYRIRASRD